MGIPEKKSNKGEKVKKYKIISGLKGKKNEQKASRWKKGSIRSRRNRARIGEKEPTTNPPRSRRAR